MVEERALEQIRCIFVKFGYYGAELREQFMILLKEALASAITDVFVISTVVILVAWVVTLLLKEVPLRRSHGPSAAE